jgi:hypothetical protein
LSGAHFTTLLVILGIVVLAIGCLLADWRPEDPNEMARRRDCDDRS